MRNTWGELKNQCINLGFDKANAYSRTPTLFVEAANRSIKLIATTIKPILRKIVIPHYPEPDSPTFVPYSMTELTEEDGKAVFFDFASDRPSIDGEPVPLFRKEGRDIILFPRSLSGDITVWYKKYPAPISQSTPDAYPLELDYDVSELVPLLMGFYVWRDDDPQRSIDYRNDFDQRRDELMASWSRPLITINPYAGGLSRGHMDF